MESKPPPDLNRLRLWREAALYITANPTLAPNRIALALGISERYLKAIVRSPYGKSLLRMYRTSPPPNLRDFRLDIESKSDIDEAVRAYLSMRLP